MIKTQFTYKLVIVFFCLISSISVCSQSKKQQELENRRQELRNEIEQINSMLFKNKSKEKSQLSLIEDLNHKINVRSNLIKVTNQQANLLTREIGVNQREITQLRQDLETLKADYAEMIVHSYKSRSEQSRVMFLMSSSNFQQAYKRLQYITQYTNYQKEQAANIKIKTEDLKVANTNLLKQKADKQELIKENSIAQGQLELERKQQRSLMASIQKDLKTYSSQIREKQQEADRIDREIEKLIREAIASSNKKAGKSTGSTGFALTPEAKNLAASFVSNKGKLPWPVEKGVVKLGYGDQPHPIVKSATIHSNGVRIATSPGAEVKAVFNGEVYAIIVQKKGNPTVLVQHGNYFTAYKNLSKVYVKKGDKVTTRQAIGQVFTNSATGDTTLSFSIFKESTTQNPASWLYRM
ncbi:murein hydrolase activator EnvC family protein [Formosa algae]|uniref:Septal ring factor EnvC (AmiA/AmiB activator) n=1 Tax=Formosa algae TaxID=225843 RepID=A0A9X1CA66_9FLAO|nr:peptidoglycan DD-metalloendopeptidase family protein [Formosa algae]MBP1838562.1 septal ring factor EnvC (AmiA/AmiB activator) [Formosa algae]MDQ0335062.1 septal ring factor EnvC (AmiA/AmiB activator) [Formosa algae]OEI79600.1 peptidase M23 [Formosa algae]PNW30250.1 peptidase M23 [Formosa algae]